MIVVSHSSFQTILSGIKQPLILLFVWDVFVTVTYYFLPFHAPACPSPSSAACWR
jgi:putative membrane protein